MVAMIQANLQAIFESGKRMSRARHQRPERDGRVSTWALGNVVRNETPASHWGQEGLDLWPSLKKSTSSTKRWITFRHAPLRYRGCEKRRDNAIR